MSRNACFSLTCMLLCLVPVAASAGDKSLGVAYGPTDQVRFSMDWDRWGIYVQPILSWSDSENSGWERLEGGGRGGIYRAYSPFAYKAMECRLVGGAGAHFVLRTMTFKPAGREIKTRQQAFEAWMQPEFRFYQRFSVLLQAQLFRYVIEGPVDEIGDQRAEFEVPDLSLSSLRIGLKYYLPIRRK